MFPFRAITYETYRDNMPIEFLPQSGAGAMAIAVVAVAAVVFLVVFQAKTMLKKEKAVTSLKLFIAKSVIL